MDKTKLQHLVEVELIALRIDDKDTSAFWKKSMFCDPFSRYQDGKMSKRKLIEVIAEHIAKELHESID